MAPLVIVLLLLTSAPLTAQSRQLTISEVLAQIAPEAMWRTRTAELFPPLLPDLAENADLVVHATVTPLRTYMSSDQAELYTDYAVKPIRAFKQRIVMPTNTPGGPPPIVLKKWGGETTINGVSVTFQDLDMRDFKPGEELVLLLSYDKSDGKYTLTKDAGAFSVRNGLIEARLEHPNHRQYEGLSTDEVSLVVQQSGRQ
jgi:hypothetical protein